MENEHDNELATGQEGTTGNDRGMQDAAHDVPAGGDQAGAQRNNEDGPGGIGTRTNGPGDGGSSSQTPAAGSDGSGGKGSIAAGLEGAGGDSVKGAKQMDTDQE